MSWYASTLLFFFLNNAVCRAEEIPGNVSTTSQPFSKAVTEVSITNLGLNSSDSFWNTTAVVSNSTEEEITLNELFNGSANTTVDKGGGESKVAEEEDESSGLGASTSAVILTGVFALIAVAGYMGFIVWRRRRYGNNEMLITDDVYDISDLRNFEI